MTFAKKPSNPNPNKHFNVWASLRKTLVKIQNNWEFFWEKLVQATPQKINFFDMKPFFGSECSNEIEPLPQNTSRSGAVPP